MLILLVGIFGMVALPFIILMAPVLLWLAIPTAVLLGVRYTLSTMSHGHWKPSPSGA